MSQLTPAVWAFVAAVAAVLLALLGATACVVLRRRSRIARLPGLHVVGLFALVAVPWLVVLLAPITIRVSIRGLGPLLGWLAVALACFMALVAAPLAVALAAGVWLAARRRAASTAASAAAVRPPASDS